MASQLFPHLGASPRHHSTLSTWPQLGSSPAHWLTHLTFTSAAGQLTRIDLPRLHLTPDLNPEILYSLPKPSAGPRDSVMRHPSKETHDPIRDHQGLVD